MYAKESIALTLVCCDCELCPLFLSQGDYHIKIEMIFVSFVVFLCCVIFSTCNYQHYNNCVVLIVTNNCNSQHFNT